MLLWEEPVDTPGGKRRSNITQGEATKELGFKAEVVYQSDVMLNVTEVEAALQQHFQSRDLGTERLWRCVAMGQQSNVADVTEGTNIYKVFITYSYDVPDAIETKKLKVNY